MKNPSSHQSDIDRIREVFRTIYNPDPRDRSHLWHPRNPVSVYFRQAQERALIELFNQADLAIENFIILDVGCGTGSLLCFFASLGAPPRQLHGLDLLPGRIEQARLLCPPGINLEVGNAESIPYPDDTFDVACQFTVFSSIFDAGLRSRIAGEMLRVLKPGGRLLWYDARVGNRRTTLGIEDGDLPRLFPGCLLLFSRSLHPPYATRLARHSFYLCETLDRFPGIKKTHLLALLQKPA